MTKNSIKTLIVDDEPLVRERILELLRVESDFEVLGIATNGNDAIARILDLNPDVVFLDIQMPDKNGFEVIEDLPEERIPMIVFITAFSDYSIKAFRKNAIDYLLKPINQESFGEMLLVVKNRIREKHDADLGRKLKSLLNLDKTDTYPKHLPVRAGDAINLVNVDDILHLNADGNYLVLQTKNKAFRYRETIKNIESRLNPEKFQRIHRSTIVNLSEIKSLHHLYKGEYEIKMSNSDSLTSSRTYNCVIQEIIGKGNV